MDRKLADNRVTQDNALIEAHYAMSLNEKRLLLAAISQLDPGSNAWARGVAEATITAQQWTAAFGVTGNPYRDLKSAADSLYERSVQIEGNHRAGKKIRWLSAEKYTETEGYVTIYFSPQILFFLTGMIEQFTSFRLLSVSGLKSTYSIRLYELAAQFRSTGWRTIEVAELRQLMGAGKAYPKFSDFRRKVIDHACSEVSKKSDLEVTWKPKKHGARIHSIEFFVSDKRQGDLF